jgi:hypothetical protein
LIPHIVTYDDIRKKQVGFNKLINLCIHIAFEVRTEPHLSFAVGPNLCDPCSQSTPSCTAPLLCSTTTNRCECQSGYVQIGNNCCKYKFDITLYGC